MNRGFVFALVAAALFGLSTPVSKLMIGTTDPWMLAGLLYFGSGVGVLILFLVRGLFSSDKNEMLKKNEIPWLLGATFFGGGLGPVFLMYGLSHTSSSTSSLLLNLESVLTSVLAWTVFKEHFEKRIVLGMASIVVGGIILSWPRDFGSYDFIGPGFIFLACLSWAIDNNLTRKISASDPVQITMIKSILAGATNIFLAILMGAHIPSLKIVSSISLIGFFGYGMSLICFVFALRNIGTSRTGAYFSTAPFVGAAASLLLFNEPITIPFLVSSGFMAFGVWLHLTEIHKHVHTHEPITHQHLHTHDEHHQHEHSQATGVNIRHSHEHTHEPLTHSHIHYPDIHHRHSHNSS